MQLPKSLLQETRWHRKRDKINVSPNIEPTLLLLIPLMSITGSETEVSLPSDACQILDLRTRSLDSTTWWFRLSACKRRSRRRSWFWKVELFNHSCESRWLKHCEEMIRYDDCQTHRSKYSKVSEQNASRIDDVGSFFMIRLRNDADACTCSFLSKNFFSSPSRHRFQLHHYGVQSLTQFTTRYLRFFKEDDERSPVYRMIMHLPDLLNDLISITAHNNDERQYDPRHVIQMNMRVLRTLWS